jgi:hypothetical protein
LPSASDPTLVAVDATDKVSGVASGSIEISQSGSGVWQELPAQMEGSRLTARIDDAALPAGNYVLRATAVDQAGNEASTETRLDGQAMAVTLPLRTVTGIQAGFQITRTVVHVRRRHGKPVRVRQRVTVTQPTARIQSGKVVQVVGRVTNPAGQGIAGEQISVFSTSSVAAEQPVGVVQTDASGTYTYAAPGSSSRTLRFAFAGSPVLLPSQASVTMTVTALTSLTVNRKRLRNGQTVAFTGALHTLPAPPGGKLLELQVRLPKGWETFRTIRTDAAGHWTARYHFTRTFGVQHYRFRARLPEEAGYPFVEGGSRAVTVEVRGRR